MLSNNYLNPITDEAEREDPAYSIPFPGFKLRRNNTGIWEAAKGGLVIMGLDYIEVLNAARNQGWLK